MQISWRKHSSLHNIIFNSFGLLFVLWSMLTKGPNNIDAYNYMDLFIYQQCKKFRFQIFLIAFLWNFFLCQDRWHSDVPQQLAQLCYVALGWALFDILQRSWCIFFSQTPEFSVCIWLVWETPHPLPYHAGQNISKFKLQMEAQISSVHTC